MMVADRHERAARRRAGIRFALGRPGSLRRWFIGSFIWCGLIGLAIVVTGKLVLMFVAVIPVIAAFALRSLVVGDEDELRAAFVPMLKSARRDALESVGMPQHETAPPEEWLNSIPDRFADVPPPPVAEEQ